MDIPVLLAQQFSDFAMVLYCCQRELGWRLVIVNDSEPAGYAIGRDFGAINQRLTMIEQLKQTRPEAALFVARGLVQDTRENPFQFTRIEIQPLTGWTEIEFGFFDDNGFEMAHFTARALAAARMKFQFVNGIEFSCESACIFFTVKQLVQ